MELKTPIISETENNIFNTLDFFVVSASVNLAIAGQLDACRYVQSFERFVFFLFPGPNGGR